MIALREPTPEVIERLRMTLRSLITGVSDGALEAGFAPFQIWPLLLTDVARGLSQPAANETAALLRALADEIDADGDLSMGLRTARAADAVTQTAILTAAPPAGTA